MKAQNCIIPFGKYKGKDLLFVTENNPRYLLWLESVAYGPLKEEIDKLIETDYFWDAVHERDMWEEAAVWGFDPVWDVGDN